MFLVESILCLQLLVKFSIIVQKVLSKCACIYICKNFQGNVTEALTLHRGKYFVFREYFLSANNKFLIWEILIL